MRMSKRFVAGLWIALMAGGAFAPPALAAGSDVARYPTTDADSSGTMMEPHYRIGVPEPRVRAFVKAPWNDATDREPFQHRHAGW